MKTIVLRFLRIGTFLIVCSSGCSEDTVSPTPEMPLSVTQFTANPRSVLEDGVVTFSFQAKSGKGLARGIVDFRDGSGYDTVGLSGNLDSGVTSHTYRYPGTYKPQLTVEDISGQRALKYDSVYVGPNQLPQIISRLDGFEASVSHVAEKSLATDPEGDPFTVTVAPVSSGLIFQMNATSDSVIYYLTNPDDNGTKQGKITVVDQKNRTVEKVVDIVFAPRDDISGVVQDRFKGTYLESYNPSVVMNGPFTGWVQAITGTDTQKVVIASDGSYKLPKLPNAAHKIHAWIDPPPVRVPMLS
jgi:hypothetical protein